MNSDFKSQDAFGLTDSYQIRLESILDNMVDGLVTINERGEIQSFNKACERMFGYASAEVLGKNINILMPEPYAQDHDQYLDNYYTTGQAKIIGIGREVEAKRKDGTVFPIDLSVNAVQIGDQRFFSGIIRDISGRKEGERFAGLLAAIVESSDDAIISKNLDGIITSWNSGAEKVFGYTAAETIGRHISMIIPSDRMPEEAMIINQLRSGKKLDHFNTVRKHKDGHEIQVSLTVSPIRDPEGRIIGASKIARDMTESVIQEERQRQTQKMEAVGQLTSGVAHDFNNLLTVVLGNTRLVRRMIRGQESLPFVSDLLERVDDIDTAAQRGADLVRRLMIFTRQRPMEATIVHVNSCIEETQGLLCRALGEMIDITAELGQDISPIRIDHDQLVNAIINISVNARDAMPRGGSLFIRTENVVLSDMFQFPGLKPGPYVLISIADTGTGMPEDVRDRIFEPFFTTKPAGEGTGLGLSMVYGFIQQSSGHITVESVSGKGSTFLIYLPAITEGHHEQ